MLGRLKEIFAPLLVPFLLRACSIKQVCSIRSNQIQFFSKVKSVENFVEYFISLILFSLRPLELLLHMPSRDCIRSALILCDPPSQIFIPPCLDPRYGIACHYRASSIVCLCKFFINAPIVFVVFRAYFQKF